VAFGARADIAAQRTTFRAARCYHTAVRRSLLVLVAALAASPVAADRSEVPDAPVVTVTNTRVTILPELAVDDAGPPADVMDTIASTLAGNLTVKIEIDAYANGPDARKVSQQHAEAVRDALVARGLLPEQLVARGRGTGASKGQSANHVDLVVVGKIRLPDVRPPVAADLATYTKAMTGSGALTATLETTAGAIHCALLDADAPMTVANFIGLATGQKPWRSPKDNRVIKGKPFYDGTIFHRVIPGFMIQGGDILGTGQGYAGYRFRNETAAGLTWSPGTLAMANAGPNTNGSQFFITEGAPTHLGAGYTIFGRCQEIDVVKAIAAVPRDAVDKPKEAVTLTKVTISRAP
jgi:peptidyl-prolyl cis-trans isomerase A (cyclophilin A)